MDCFTNSRARARLIYFLTWWTVGIHPIKRYHRVRSIRPRGDLPASNATWPPWTQPRELRRRWLNPSTDQLIVSSTWENQLCANMDRLLEEELVIPSVKYECKFRSRIFPLQSFVFTENLRTEILGVSLRDDYWSFLLHSRNLTQLVRNLGISSNLPNFRSWKYSRWNRRSLLQISTTPRMCSEYQVRSLWSLLTLEFVL